MLDTDPAMRRRAELSERHLTEKRPHWTREMVLRKIEAVFPGSGPSQIVGMLESAAPDHFPDWGKYRIQLAIIKLCDESKGLSVLPHNVNAAKLDYRDVLAWAEEPHVIGLALAAGDAEREEASKRDLEQYLRWIEQDRKGKG
jgi:hypothetical protein